MTDRNGFCTLNSVHFIMICVFENYFKHAGTLLCTILPSGNFSSFLNCFLRYFIEILTMFCDILLVIPNCFDKSYTVPWRHCFYWCTFVLWLKIRNSSCHVDRIDFVLELPLYASHVNKVSSFCQEKFSGNLKDIYLSLSFFVRQIASSYFSSCQGVLNSISGM